MSLSFRHGRVVVFHEDAHHMDELVKDLSIDCVLTDPPYHLDKLADGWNVKRLKESAQRGKVVKSLPVGMKFDPKQGHYLQDFMSRMSVLLMKKVKPGGFFLCFSQPRLVHRVAVGMEEAGFEIRDLLVWKRTSQAKAFSMDHFIDMSDHNEAQKARLKARMKGLKIPMLKGAYEAIVLAQKPKQSTFLENYQTWGTGLINTQTPNKGFPSNLFDIKKPNKQERQFAHFTLKPIALMERLLQIFTTEGQTVLDPFMGSGSSAVACQRLNRHCIGIEKNEEYFRLCEKKVAHYAQKKASSEGAEETQKR